MPTTPSKTGPKMDLGSNMVVPGKDTMGWEEFRHLAGRTKDRMMVLRLISAATGYKPLTHQLRAHRATARHKLLLGGVGSGKTYFSVVEMVMLSIMNPGCNAAFFAPTFDAVCHVLRPAWEEIVDALARIGCPLELNYSKSMARADLVGGGSVFWRSASRIDSCRGWTLSHAAIDETEAMYGVDPLYVHNTVNGRLRATNAYVHQIHHTTTPKGYRGIPRLYHQKRMDETEREDWWAARAPTSANTHLPPGFIDSLKSGHSKRSYQEEVEGKILAPDNLVLPEFNREANVRPWAYDRALPYHLACDWGYAHPYFCWIQEHPDGSFTVFDEFFENEVPIGHQKQLIINRCKALKKDPTCAIGDRAIKDMMSWLIHNFPRTKTMRMKDRQEQSVFHGVELMRSLIDPVVGSPRFYIASHLAKSEKTPRSLMHAVKNYRWKVDREGLLTDEPYKDNTTDHAMDAVRMAMVALASDRPKPFVLGSSNAVDIFRHPRRHR